MRRRIAPGLPPPGERGFVLLGAVMFIVVLTILALSLFSLSGYEAQFMRDAFRRARVYHAAAGGIDRARFALGRTLALESVKSALPLDDIVYAVARQGPDSIGPLQSGAGADSVLVRVKATRDGVSRMVEMCFKPERPRALYDRLMVLSDPAQGLVVRRFDPSAPAIPRWPQTELYGEVWQNHGNVPQAVFPLASGAEPSLALLGAPDPDLATFLAIHWAAPSTTEMPKQTSSDPYVLDAAGYPDDIRFFRTSGVDGAWNIDATVPQPRIQVNGTIVWMFDRGLRVDHTLRILGSGNSNDMIVLVARAQTTDPVDPGAGLALLGSLDSPTVPVVLISDGAVLLEHRSFGGGNNDDENSSTVAFLSVFAGRASVLGPKPNPLGPLRFQHPAVHQGKVLIDKLTDLGLLPNTQGAVQVRLSPLAGTWRDVTESNPN